MATLTVISSAITGTVFAPVAAGAGGDVFANDGNTRYYVKNGSGGSLNVIIATPGLPGGLTLTPVTVAVGAGVEKILGPFPPQYFNNASGQVSLTYSGVTSMTVLPFN
jgi:hypothetical protein